MKPFRCMLGVHKYVDEATQISKNICYGDGIGSPGYRTIQKCILCGQTNVIKLNLCTPNEDLYNDRLWK